VSAGQLGRASALALALALALSCGGAAPAGRPITLRLAGADGAPVSSEAWRGAVTVVHLFTTWSLAAQQDVLQLTAAAAAGTRVVGVSLDVEPALVVPPWRRGADVRYPLLWADDAVRSGEALGSVDEIPVTLVLDRAGRVHRRHVGPLPAGALAGWVRDADRVAGR
jgi:hypothetical protein